MILLVDDNPDLRTATRSMLEAVGFEVLAAQDGQEAWRQFQQRAEQVTILLTDLRMPGLDGLQLIRKIRSRSGLPIILMSTHVSPATDREIEQVGAVRLDKPFSVQQLQEAVKQAQARSATLEARPLQASPPEGTAPAGRTRWLLGLAAGVLLALGLGNMIDRRAPELPAPVLEERVRGSEIKALVPKGPVGSQPRQLHWQPLPAASHYRIEITAVDGRSIWRGESASPSVELPESVQAGLLANVAYYWRVRAYDADDTWVGASAEARFRVIEPAATTPGLEDS